MSFDQDYNRGLDALHDYAPQFYRLVRFIGRPVGNYDIPTAQVGFDPIHKNVTFQINPDYISDLSDEQVGFVIAHESYHVLLDHFSELRDRVNFPDLNTLTIGQECIINDTILNSVGLDSPDNIYTGDKYDEDFSQFNSKQAYDFLKNENDEDEDSQEEGDSSDNTSSQDNQEDKNPNDSSSGSDSEGSDQGSESHDENSEDDSKPQSCGGVYIPEGSLSDFIKEVAGAANDFVKSETADSEDLSDEMIEIIDSISDTSGIDILGGYSVGNVSGSMFYEPSDDMNLDWKSLIARINPKIMTSGKDDSRDSWHSSRRKMISMYPQVILPTRQSNDGADDEGDSNPTFILALDMSISIPTYLIDGLASLADSIPEKFVKVRPVTWSDTVVPFDTEDRRIVRRGGTRIQELYYYVQKVEKEIGKKPYVFVITDGGCNFYDSTTSTEDLQKYWYWGAINTSSISTIKYNFRNYLGSDSVFDVNEFLEK